MKGKSYLMYAFFFLQNHEVLRPLTTRALEHDAQHEEGPGSGVSTVPLSGKKRKDKK